jgi:replication factor A1
MKGVDVKATIVEIPTANRVVTRWGTESYVSNAIIADETGSIRLTLWNDYINKIRVGDEVEIKNGYVSSFAGQFQLRLGRKSTLSIINHLHPKELI